MELATSAADALVVLFNALAEDEQDAVYDRLTELRVAKLAGSESSRERFIRSMRTVAEYVGHVPSIDECERASQELRDAGEDVETFSRVYAHFKTWPRAKEALALSETTTAKRTDAASATARLAKSAGTPRRPCAKS